MLADREFSVTELLIYNIKTLVHSRLPYEFCGLIAGQKDVLSEVVEVANSADSARNGFVMEPNSLIHAIRQIEQMELEWMGVIHSHPNGTRTPSISDIKGWNYPNLLYGIATLLSDDQMGLYLYRLQKGLFIRQQVRWI
jgi:proteasome lid subunit RPN8/RPN11